MNKNFIIIGAIVIVVVGIGGWFYFSSQSPQPAKEPQQKETAISDEPQDGLTTAEKVTARSFAEKVLGLLQNRDYGEVYDLLRDEDKAKKSRNDYIKDAVEKIGSLTITSWEIKEVLEEQDGASVQYVMKLDNPLYSSETGLLSLVKKNGEWSLAITFDEVTIEKGIGDEVVFTSLKYTVNKVEEKQVLTSKYNDPVSAKENAKFVVIDLSVTNLTNEAFDLPYGALLLIDNRDRQFDTYENVYFAVDNYLDGRNLPPSITEKGVLVYEIPQDATSYSLYTAKAGTNEAYKVILR